MAQKLIDMNLAKQAQQLRNDGVQIARYSIHQNFPLLKFGFDFLNIDDLPI